MIPTTALPLPAVPPEVAAFAAEKGASDYLPRVLELARRLFPEAPIVLQVYEDHEIRDLKKILIEIQVPADTDFLKTIWPQHNAWGSEIFKVCPATHVHLFGITFETMP